MDEIDDGKVKQYEEHEADEAYGCNAGTVKVFQSTLSGTPME